MTVPQAHRKHKMDISLLVLGLFVAVLIGVAHLTGGWSTVLSGLQLSSGMLKTVWLRMFLGILMAGMMQVLIPAEVIAHWMGKGSGFRGILVGTAAGAISPGGPFVNFPIVAVLQNSGAGIGPLAAYLTAWGVIPVHRTLVWELPFLEHDFVFARLLASLFAPIVVGLLTPAVLEVLAKLSGIKIPG